MMTQNLHAIMMPDYDDARRESVFAHAAAVAKRFNAQIRVIHCRANTQDMIPFGDMIPGLLRGQVEEATQKALKSGAAKARERFKEDAAKHGMETDPKSRGIPSALFVEYQGKPTDAIRHHGRLSDLICMSRPTKGEGLGMNALKSALFTSGRPVMVCPDSSDVPEDIGRHVTIGWNGSLAATRAVALAAPLISGAERVTILAGGRDDHVATPGDFADYLRLRGVKAEIARFEIGPDIGRQLLEITARAGASLLVVGAHHDSNERMILLGGVSASVVEETTLPVVMAH